MYFIEISSEFQLNFNGFPYVFLSNFNLIPIYWNFQWYFIEISTEFLLDFWWISIGISLKFQMSFNRIFKEFPIFHWNFNWIFDWFQMDCQILTWFPIHWNFQWYFIEISTEFLLDFQWISIGISLKFPMNLNGISK